MPASGLSIAYIEVSATLHPSPESSERQGIAREFMMRFRVLFVAAILGCAGSLYADPLYLWIRPIQVCSDAGVNCADPTRDLYEAVGEKIWAQADITLSFLPWFQLNDSSHADVSDAGDWAPGNELFDLWTKPGNNADPDPYIVSMWFVHTLNDSSSYYGTSWLGLPRVTIAWDAVSGYGLNGRLDTIAHELGHVLGLDTRGGATGHYGTSDYLMASGGIRSIPSTIDDINPDGLQLDKLDTYQTDTAKDSRLLHDSAPVPEPGTLVLFALGLAALAAFRRP